VKPSSEANQRWEHIDAETWRRGRQHFHHHAPHNRFNHWWDKGWEWDKAKGWEWTERTEWKERTEEWTERTEWKEDITQQTHV